MHSSPAGPPVQESFSSLKKLPSGTEKLLGVLPMPQPPAIEARGAGASAGVSFHCLCGGEGKSSSSSLLRDWKAGELRTVGNVGFSGSQAKFKPRSVPNYR